MSEKQEKKWSEIVREERDKGNVVFLCIDSVMVAPIKEIIKQPAEGLLWDLNRDGVTALSFMDKEGMTHWINNFAVSLVIRELKSQLTQLEEENAALKRALHELAQFDYRLGIDAMRKFAFDALPADTQDQK